MKQLIKVVLFLSASPLVAQQVVSVSSGEHGAFTRLVLKVDPEKEWELVEERGLATIRFPDQSLSFSTARIYNRISADRILAVRDASTETGSELRLDLACKCEVQSSAFNGNYIVIDVFDGPPLDEVEATASARMWQPDSLPFIQPSNTPLRFTAFVMADAPAQPQILPDPPPREIAEASASEMAMLATPEMTDDELEIVANDQMMEPPAEEGVVVEMENAAGAVVSDMNQTVEAEDNPEMLARIEAAQSQLLAQLTRAADQGLVEFVPAPIAVVEVQPEPEPEVIEAPEPEPIDPALMQQLSARTAYSQNTEDALTDIINQFAMPQCLDDAVFSMEGWNGEESFSSRLAMLRSGLLGEFDTPDAKIAESIVQLYLSYGLGAEARLILKETGVNLTQADLYDDMASLIEGEPVRVSGPILKGAGCGGAHEMWYLAAGLGDYQVLEPLTITDAFSNYPIEVRSQIGPPLAQAFIDRGQVEAGHVVLEIVRRAESGISPTQLLAEAQVMEAQGDLAGAAKVYRDLALDNGEKAPEALVAYARTLLATGDHLPDTLLVDLESAAFFHRNTDSANPLRLWEIKVRAELAGAEAALMQIEENLGERPELKAPLQEIAADIFINNSAEMLGDYPYAQMVLRYEGLLDQGPLGDEARLKIAEEMAGIGLPETALDLLSPNLERATEGAQLIEAAAYVQLFQPARALDILAKDASLAAYKIRLNAYLQMEDFAAVAMLLNDDHAQEISLNEVALRAGDWAKIQAAGAVGTLASYVRGGADDMAPEETLPPMMADENPTLKAARALLADNQQSMQFLEDVLAEGE
jgi:hypothetical protein